MASGREIKTKIKSTQNMRKVTRALEMVSASKIRKAQDMMKASRPYTQHMRKVVTRIAQANTECAHPFLVPREQVNKVGFIIVSTDRGLCGGLNSNLFRNLLVQMRGWQDQGAQIDVVAIGQKAVQFFRRIQDIELTGTLTHIGESPHIEQLIGVIKLMLDAYQSHTVDRVFLAYNHFVNTMTQKVMIDTLLPLPLQQEEISGDQSAHLTSDFQQTYSWDYLYEPDAESVLAHVLGRYIEAVAYQGVLENQASEHAARMVAMKSASDNANKVIDSLTLVYNKARQAAITQEISEIVGGASAV